MTKDVVFTYQKIGNIIVLEEDDWRLIVDYLEKHNISVFEKSKRPTSKVLRAVDVSDFGAGWADDE